MKKRNVYLFQPTYMNANAVSLPYAVCTLSAYAWSQPDIDDAFSLKKIFFLRDPLEKTVGILEEPFLVGFSAYMWNIEYNKALAKRIKDRFPDCRILFGGPQIPPGHRFLAENPFVDILIHGEGEIPFAETLRALRVGASLSGVAGLSFRDDGGLHDTAASADCRLDRFPSPYLTGIVDRLIEENPDIQFDPLVETNRGCPNHCAYCSWGGTATGVRFFPLERVYEEMEWIGRFRPAFFGISDSNFGMFPRDEKITDKLIEIRKKTGYPKRFQVSYSKDSGDRVFSIAKKLTEAGLCKGVTLSFQTMSEEAQKNIGRSNIEIEYYKDMLHRYTVAGIPTYTELIIGLPGETVETFFDGIDTLLEYGQHTSMVIHLCEWLPLSPMGESEYMEKYRIRYKVIPLNQPHASIREAEEIPEFSRIVTSTYSMPEADWKRITLFATCVLCFHHMGLLQLPALHLYFRQGIKYSRFYDELLQFLLRDPEGIFSKIAERLDGILTRGDSAVFFDRRFGETVWGFEEYAFLCTVYEKERFYREIDPFLKRFIPDDDFRREMLAFQSFSVKSISDAPAVFEGRYQWKEYFAGMRLNEASPLKEKRVRCTVGNAHRFADWADYAKEVVWFGRRGGKNLYTSEIEEADADE